VLQLNCPGNSTSLSDGCEIDAIESDIGMEYKTMTMIK